MAQVWVRNGRGMQDSKSLDEISQACGGKSESESASVYFCTCFKMFSRLPQLVLGAEEEAEEASRRADGPQSPLLWSWKGRSVTKET